MIVCIAYLLNKINILIKLFNTISYVCDIVLTYFYFVYIYITNIQFNF